MTDDTRHDRRARDETFPAGASAPSAGALRRINLGSALLAGALLVALAPAGCDSDADGADRADSADSSDSADTEAAAKPEVVSWESDLKADGTFKRMASAYREPAPTDEPDRYVVYGSHACPWATRVKMLLRMLGLEEVVGYVDCDPVFGVIDEATKRTGWVFSERWPDPLYGEPTLKDVYLRGNPSHASKSTTPMLWDRAQQRVLHNESQEIALHLHDDFRKRARHPEVDLYPQDMRGQIDAFYADVYEPLLNGVYRAGFATDQASLDAVLDEVFEALDGLEALLATQRWMLGEHFTFADVIVFPTLWRFDFIYAIHFKCSRRRIRDYPALSAYVREIYSWPLTRRCNEVEHTRMHYYRSHYNINPQRLVAKVDLGWMDAPHGRERLAGGEPLWFMRGA